MQKFGYSHEISVLFVEFLTRLLHIVSQAKQLLTKEIRLLLEVMTYIFIALIHPIQWTIANPVGTDQPAKHQKKTSCVSTGRPVPVLCTRQVVHRTSFLSRQRDVIASFSFGTFLC